MCLKIGTVVKTSYGTGSYIITGVSGPCTDKDCNEGKRVRPHYHFSSLEHNPVGYAKQNSKVKPTFYLNGYYQKGKEICNVLSNDKLIICSEANSISLEEYNRIQATAIELKKPGRKKGNYSSVNVEKELKTSRITARVARTTIRKLYWIREHSLLYKGLSESEIISRLIDDHLLIQEVSNYEVPRFH